jgi:hypothetical protein
MFRVLCETWVIFSLVWLNYVGTAALDCLPVALDRILTNTPLRVLRDSLTTGNTGEHERATEYFSVISETSVVYGVTTSLVP